MELDFKSVKALSSPTRINMLRELLTGENTPTTLSESLGKSKSTITSHATTLVEAGLIEQDTEEGRKRVVYRPTEKAEAIANGRKKQVRFSLISSVITGLTGIWLLTGDLGAEQQAFQAETAALDAGTATGQLSTSLLAVSIGLFTVTLITLWYGFHIRRLNPEATQHDNQ